MTKVILQIYCNNLLAVENGLLYTYNNKAIQQMNYSRKNMVTTIVMIWELLLFFDSMN